MIINRINNVMKGGNMKRIVLLLMLLGFVALSLEAADISANRHGNYIAKNEAVAIAYKHAGVKADDVTICKVRVEREKGRIVYEVEFISDGIEYEFDIDAISGKILGLEGDLAQGPVAPHVGFIGVDRARSIALDHAGIKPNAPIMYSKIKMERDDGLIIYELDFFYNNRKYEYEIDAITGKVLEADY